MSKLNSCVSRVVINIDNNISHPSKTLNFHETHTIHMKQLKNMSNDNVLPHLMRHIGFLPNVAVSTNF